MAIWFFAPLRPYPDVELALVMIACPCLMNAIQFWVQDSFLKKDVRSDRTLAAPTSPDKAMNQLSQNTPVNDTDSEEEHSVDTLESATQDNVSTATEPDTLNSVI